MNSIQQFYSNETMREDVKAFLVDVLEKRAVEKVFQKGAVAGFYEAKKTIEKAFDIMEEIYGDKPEPLISNSR